MNGGRSARFGFRFSDLLIIERVLQYLIQKRSAEIEGTPVPLPPIFWVESPAPADEAPDWDIQQHDPGSTAKIILEEVKSGPLAASDRKKLWSRLRRTIAKLDPTSSYEIIPQLTTNPDNPTEHADRWTELPTLSSTANASVLPEAVSSAKTLAEEAMYCLTHNQDLRSGNESAVLSVEHARHVMAAFKFKDDIGANDLDGRVEQLVAELTGDLGATQQICDALSGGLFRRASSTDLGIRRFGPEELWSEVDVLRHLAEVSQEDARLWQAWWTLSEQVPPVGPSQGSLGLEYQDWRGVQPLVAEAVAHRPRLLTLTARGGLGKTIVLKYLRREADEDGAQTLWLWGRDLRGKTPGQVRRALSLGSFVARSHGKRPAVFIDGFENAADDDRTLRDLLTALDECDLGDAGTISISVRASTWGKLAGSEESVSRWVKPDFRDWDKALVATLVRASQRPQISQALLEILRTPLLLDIFLRTFGTEQEVPPALQSRHAVLLAYFDRRVWPPDRPGSAERRRCLHEACEREARGLTEHSLLGTAAHDLESEGVLALLRGLYVFRHPLLRDFAMLFWARSVGQSAADIARQLSSISSGLTRWGALRATLEAALSPRDESLPIPNLQELIAEMEGTDPALLISAAETLGEMDDPQITPMTTILSQFRDASLASRFLQRILQIARLSMNVGWLRWLADLPDDLDWARKTPWVDSEFIVTASDLLRAVGRSNPAHMSAAVAVAKRIRSWSAAAKFQPKLAEYDGHHLLQMLPLVARLDPSADTLTWLSTHAAGPWKARWGVLEALPILLVRAVRNNLRLDGPTLVSCYCTAAGFDLDSAGLHDRVGDPPWPTRDFERTQVALIGENAKEHHGLLNDAPQLFVPVAIDIVSGLATDEQRRREKDLEERLRKLRDIVPTLVPSEPVAQLEAKLRESSGRTFTVQEATSGLVDDASVLISIGLDEVDHIIAALRHRIIQDFENDGEFVSGVYWPAAKNGHSLAAWVLLLDLLTQDRLRKPEIVDEILMQRALFQVPNAFGHVCEAIRQRWAHLNDSSRHTILKHIQETVRSPMVNGPYGVAPLMSAIPEVDRPSWSAPFFEIYRLQGIQPECRKPRQLQHGSFTYTPTPDEGEQGEVASPWKKLQSWIGRLGVDDDAVLANAMQDLRSAIAAGLPTVSDAQAADVAAVLREFLQQLSGRRFFGRPLSPDLDLSASQARELATWTIEFARRHSPESLNSDKTPVGVGNAPANATHPWVIALDILDDLLAHPLLEAESGFSDQLFQDIARIPPPLSPTLTWHLLRGLRPWHWLREGSNGRDLLGRILQETPADAGVLEQGFRHAIHFEREQSEKLFRTWLTVDGAVSTDTGLDKFASEIGELFGRIIFDEGIPKGPQVLTDEFLRVPPASGILGRPENYVSWALGLIFGAKEAMVRRHLGDEPTVMRFVTLLERVFHQISQLDHPDLYRFIIFALHPLEQIQDPELLKRFWSRFQQLALRIVEIGKPGDAYVLFSQVQRHPIVAAVGPARLMPLIEALGARVEQLGQRINEPLVGQHNWADVLKRVAEEYGDLVAASDLPQATKDRLHRIFERWADLGVASAIEAARKIRGASQ